MPQPLGTIERIPNVGRAATYRLHAGQWDAWEARERFVAMIAGSGGGKTSFGPLWLYREMHAHPGEYLAVSPTVAMLNRVLVPAIMSLMGSRGALYAKAEGRIELPNGSVIFLASAETPERVEGIHASGAWMDEAGQMDALMWETVRRRVAHHQGRILLTTTPYNMGWLKSQVADRALAGEDEYRVITFSSISNPAYPREEFERAKREMSPDRFAMFYLGEFRRASGLVYPAWSPARMLVDAESLPQHIEPPPDPWDDGPLLKRPQSPDGLPASWRRVGGLDLGWHNATAAVLIAEAPDGSLYVTREHFAVETLLAEHADVLRQWGDVCLYADPSARQGLEELRSLGLWVESANNDVLAGIDAVTRAIRADRLRALKGQTPNLLREFESYQWEHKDDKPLDRPRKVDDHVMDALRYAIMALRQPGDIWYAPSPW